MSKVADKKPSAPAKESRKSQAPSRAKEPKPSSKPAQNEGAAPKDRAEISREASQRDQGKTGQVSAQVKAMEGNFSEPKKDEARTLADAPSKDGSNCIDRAASQARPEDQALFLKDNRPNDDNQAGHVVLERDGRVLDPTSGQSYANREEYLRANPQYGKDGQLSVEGQTSGQNLKSIVEAPDAASRQAALESAGLTHLREARFADQPPEMKIDAATRATEAAVTGYQEARAMSRAANARLAAELKELKEMHGDRFDQNWEERYTAEFNKRNEGLVQKEREAADRLQQQLETLNLTRQEQERLAQGGALPLNTPLNLASARALDQLVDGYGMLAETHNADASLRFVRDGLSGQDEKLQNFLENGRNGRMLEPGGAVSEMVGKALPNAHVKALEQASNGAEAIETLKGWTVPTVSPKDTAELASKSAAFASNLNFDKLGAVAAGDSNALKNMLEHPGRLGAGFDAGMKAVGLNAALTAYGEGRASGDTLQTVGSALSAGDQGLGLASSMLTAIGKGKGMATALGRLAPGLGALSSAVDLSQSMARLQDHPSTGNMWAAAGDAAATLGSAMVFTGIGAGPGAVIAMLGTGAKVFGTLKEQEDLQLTQRHVDNEQQAILQALGLSSQDAATLARPESYDPFPGNNGYNYAIGQPNRYQGNEEEARNRYVRSLLPASPR